MGPPTKASDRQFDSGKLWAGCSSASLSYHQAVYGRGIPDEVGLFLGYPLRDVKGFMAKVTESLQRGLWQIHGPPQRSLCLNDAYRLARRTQNSAVNLGRITNELFLALIY